MADDTGNTPAQVTSAGTESQASGANNENGVEKRINEVVANYHSERKAREAAEAAVLQMTAQMTQLANEVMSLKSQAAAPVQPSEPEIEIDPEDAKKFAYLAKQTYGGKLESLESAIKQTQSMIAQLHSGMAEQKFSSVDPTILAEARRLNAKGFGTLENCVIFVRGQKAMEADAANAAARNSRNQFNGTHTIPFVSGAPNSSGNNGQVPDLPSNFEKLSPREQMKALEARNVHDKPL